MFNLLPDSLKQKIKSEYRLRFWFVVLALLLFIQLVFLFFMFPSWLTSSHKEKEAISQKALVDEPLLTSDADSVSSVTAEINVKLDILDSKLKYSKVLPFIDTILSKKGREIYINELAFTSDGAGLGSITLRGISSTRESLVSFVKKLDNTGLFNTVDLPISNFAKDRNIEFAINMTIK